MGNYYAAERKHWLFICRGYWDGTTCCNKRHAQQALATLRQARRAGII